MNRSELFALFDHAADGVHIVGEDQRIIYWNSAAKRLLGYNPAEALGHACFDLVAGGDYQGHSYCRRYCPTIRAVAQGKGLPPYDVKSQTKDGRDIWLNVSVIPMQDPECDGNLAVHLFRDVSKRRKAEMLAQQTIATVSEFSASDGAQIIDSQPAPQPPLTRRELEVLRLLAWERATRRSRRRSASRARLCATTSSTSSESSACTAGSRRSCSPLSTAWCSRAKTRRGFSSTRLRGRAPVSAG